jgi:hypothetical protein
MPARFVYPLARQAEVNSTLKDMKEPRVIEESDSVSSSPFVVLRKIFGYVSTAKRRWKERLLPATKNRGHPEYSCLD